MAAMVHLVMIVLLLLKEGAMQSLCPGLPQTVLGCPNVSCIYHYPRSLRCEPSLLLIKRGWSFTMHSTPPPLLIGRGCGCSGLTSCQRGGIGYPRTVRGNPRYTCIPVPLAPGCYATVLTFPICWSVAIRQMRRGQNPSGM